MDTFIINFLLDDYQFAGIAQQLKEAIKLFAGIYLDGGLSFMVNSLISQSFVSKFTYLSRRLSSFHMKLISLLIVQFVFTYSFAQHGLKTGDITEDISFKTVLNSTVSATKLSDLKGDITIIDFFGTWCIPCMKALPHLELLKSKYKEMHIILVSNEEETKLRKFIGKRNDVTLPLVVDKGDLLTSLFQPPSYPYTVVLGRDNRIIITLQAAELSETQVDSWIISQNGSRGILPPHQIDPIIKHAMETKEVEKVLEKKVIQLSQDFVYAAKSGDSTAKLRSLLQGLTISDLEKDLITDDEKKAFWINIYNGFTQVLLKQDPGKYKQRSHFYKAGQISLAGKRWSLDKIEHGILRRSKVKWSFGYLNKLFPGKLERALRVGKLDYRIHFALNCGAKSCPPIAFYKPFSLNQQLNTAARAYLSTEVLYDSSANTLKLPAIMGWFRGDFGGKKGMRNILRDEGIIPSATTPGISFKKYDWTLYLDNYKN